MLPLLFQLHACQKSYLCKVKLETRVPLPGILHLCPTLPYCLTFPTSSGTSVPVLYSSCLGSASLEHGDAALNCFTSCLKPSHQETSRVRVAVWCHFYQKHQGKGAAFATSPDARYHFNMNHNQEQCKHSIRTLNFGSSLWDFYFFTTEPRSRVSTSSPQSHE